MRTRALHTGSLFASVAVLATCLGATAGCGSARETGNHTEAAAQRARQVADAWDGSTAAEAWRTGYYPMGEAAQPPQSGLQGKEDQRAYEIQHFVLRSELPTSAPKDGRVVWESGGSLTLPLVEAQQTYETMARFRGDEPHLTVTGAKLGEMTLATSRGPASVPAWLFTLEGYESPLKRPAIRPSKLPPPPVRPAGSDTTLLKQIDRLVQVAGNGRAVTVRAFHGACDDGPAVDVLETRESVVLSASVKGVKDGPCAGVLKTRQVTVQLNRPLGDRVLLDARTGRPVPYGNPREPSPSWS